MGTLKKWLFPALLICGASWMSGSFVHAQSATARGDIDAQVVALQQAKAGYDDAKTAWMSAQKDLTDLLGKTHTYQEVTKAEERITKAQKDMGDYTTKVYAAIGYLKSQWGRLTQKEKDMVDSAQKDLI